MKISYYYCDASYLAYFSRGSKYIRISDSESSGKGIYLNGNHELECINDACFHPLDEKVSVMDVYSVYSCGDGSVIAGKKYGVYKVNTDGNYYIFTEKFHFEYLPKIWFIDFSTWKSLSTYERKEKIELSKIPCKRFDNMVDKSSAEESEENRKKKEQRKKLEAISNVSKRIAENTGSSVTTTVSYLPKNIFLMMLLIVIADIIFAFVTKNVVFAITAIWLLITAIVGRKSEKTVIGSKIKVDLANYEILNSMNNLPLDMLGKIKQIENYMTIMKYRQINEDIIRLIEQSINLTVFTTIQDEYYSSNKKEINERLNEFLDNILKYVKTSLQNKDMEIYQIKKNLSEDYLKMIDKNSEMFKSITEGLGNLSDIFEDKETKKEEKKKEILEKEEISEDKD